MINMPRKNKKLGIKKARRANQKIKVKKTAKKKFVRKKPKKSLRKPKRKRKTKPKRRTKKARKRRIVFFRKTADKSKKFNGAGKIYYSLNPSFAFLNDLKNLILTPPPASFVRMEKRILSLGRVKLALVSGVFLNKENVADLLIVGDDIDRRKFKNFLKSLEAEVGTQIIYAIMDKEEFNYRRAMFDRFVRLMLEGPHEVLIDRIGL